MTIPPPSGPPPSGTPASTGGELPPWAKRPQSGNRLMSDGWMTAFIGPKWDAVYRKKLALFLEDPAFVPTWNWSAALAWPAWFLYRKLYIAFAVYFLLPRFAFRILTGPESQLTMAELQKPENEWLVMMNAAVYLSTAIAAGGTANWFLFRRARAAARLVAMQQLPSGEAESLLQRVGGVNRLGTSLFIGLSVTLMLAQLRA